MVPAFDRIIRNGIMATGTTSCGIAITHGRVAALAEDSGLSRAGAACSTLRRSNGSATT